MTVEKNSTDEQALALSVDPQPDGVLRMIFSGRLDDRTTAAAWSRTVRRVAQSHPPMVRVDAAGLEYCDRAGLALFLSMAREQARHGGGFEIAHLHESFRKVYDTYTDTDFESVLNRQEHSIRPIEQIGRATREMILDMRDLIAFVGELGAAMAYSFRNPARIRWQEAFRVAETAGVNALPLVTLISFLVGLIMAFQAAIPMRMFGAEIFVANLIALSMLRELGPLMTAIALGGRSGSAFAAELGTMKVNEEIDALVTMGLDPVRFLVVVRVAAAVVVTPMLTMYANLMGLLGGAVVLLTLGYPFSAYTRQVIGAVTYVDLLGGLVKAFVFGILIAGVGCLRGLQTRSGPSAVGVSTTRAVVTSIILIVIADGVFSVVYFYLGI